ncbi:tetratricopeptide repeat protein [bacterium]|nr:tetratricopeptide repeat protein [bacterium]
MTSIINWVKKYIVAVIVIGVVTAVISNPIIKGITILFQRTGKYIACPIVINILLILLVAVAIYLIIKKVKNVKAKTIYLCSVVLAAIFLFIVIKPFDIYRNQDKTIIVISQFINEGNSKINISKRIREAFLKEINENDLSSIKVVTSSQIIPSHEKALKEGSICTRRNAKTIMVIWGWNDDVAVKTSLTIVKSPEVKMVRNIEFEKNKGQTLEEISKKFKITYLTESISNTLVFLTHSTLGIVCLLDEDYSNSEVHFNKIFNRKASIDEEFENAKIALHYFRGDIYYCQANYRLDKSLLQEKVDYEILCKESMKLYEKSTEEFSKACNLIENRKKAIPDNNDFTEMLDDIRKYYSEKKIRELIEINPNEYFIYKELGDLLAESKRYKEAEEAYRKAIKINPNKYFAYKRLGVLLIELKSYEEAEKIYKQAINECEDQGLLNYDLACLYSIQKKTSEAIKYLERAVNIDEFCKIRAQHEGDFINIRNTREFKKIVGENK